LGAGGARRCARSGRTSIAGRSALRQVGAAVWVSVFRGRGSLRARTRPRMGLEVTLRA
jgi:hypothetical protein